MAFLLTVLTVVVTILTAALIGVLFLLFALKKKGQSTSGVHFKKGDIEDMLSRGSTKDARAAASAWRREQPRNTAAYQLLAKAHFQLQEYVECKRVLEELIAFAPEFEFSSRSYLERIEKELKDNRPRIVDSGDR